jgi:hypothetical protein
MATASGQCPKYRVKNLLALNGTTVCNLYMSSSSSLHGLRICLFRLHTASRHLFFGLHISLFPEGLYWSALFGNLVSCKFICWNQLLRYCSIVSFTAYIFSSVLIISFVIRSSFVQPLVFRRKFISVLCILVWTFLVKSSRSERFKAALHHLTYLAVVWYPTLRKLIMLKIFTVCSRMHLHLSESILLHRVHYTVWVTMK